MSDEAKPKKSPLVMIIIVVVVIIAAVVVYFLMNGDKNETANANNAKADTNVVVTEAPFILSGSTKIFGLKLVNGLLVYKTMTFYAGDNIQINLTSDGQPVDFEFQNIGAKSASGVFSTQINTTDPGGVYQLICSDRNCGAITVTVINPNANLNTNTTLNTNQSANTNQTADTNSSNQITKVELQRLPAGTAFTPGMNMATTTSFEVGDQYGIGVTGTFATGTQLTRTITDASGTVVLSDGPSNLSTGTNGSCCFALPSTTGMYNVRLSINGTFVQSIPIYVAE